MTTLLVILLYLVLVNVVLATIHVHVTKSMAFAWSHLIIAVVSLVSLLLGVSGWLN